MGRKEEIVEKVRAVAAPLAVQEGLELIDVQLGGAGRTELTLFIDRVAPRLSPGDGQDASSEDPREPAAAGGPSLRPGVTLDDCADFSRIVSAALDVEDPLDGAYELVVSSPGLDRPLRTPEHFVKYAGNRCRVKTYGPVPECGNLKTFVGELKGFDAGRAAVLVDVDGKLYAVPLAQVSKAHLDPLFE
jgi:ribosome maturation factor RimP